MIKNLLFIAVFKSLMWSQVGPPDDLRSNPPRSWALTNGVIHTSPTKTIENGTVVIRDGLIQSVGERIKIPNQATIIDLKGKHVYAGFIESWLDVKTSTDDSSIVSHWNSNMRSHLKASSFFQLNEKNINEMRKLGFTTAHIAPKGGIFQGTSALIQLDKNSNVLNENISQVIEYSYGGWSSAEYPTSLLGAIAFIRQGLIDADWYAKSKFILEKYPDENEPIAVDRSLEILGNAKNDKVPFIFRTNNEVYIDRSVNIGKEFDLDVWIKGNGYEYRRINQLPRAFTIIPLNFSSKPKVEDHQNALQYSTAQLKHWDMGPDNAKRLSEANIPFSLTSDGLKKKSDFRKNLLRAVERGLSKRDAIAALTTIPAEKFGQSRRLGKVSRGFLANLIVMSGDYFDNDSKVTSLWIGGNEHPISPDKMVTSNGKWTLKEGDNVWTLSIDSGKGSIEKDEVSFKLSNLNLDQDRITFTVKADTIMMDGVNRFKGTIRDNSILGQVIYSDGLSKGWSASFNRSNEEKVKKPNSKEEASKLNVVFPEGSYGLDSKVLSPGSILINNATIWTSGPLGILKDHDILFENGKVKQIAKDIVIPRGNALVINGSGKHVTPGLIDAHSHMAGESINEGFQNITAEVRMQDVIDPNDVAMYRALAGGLTTINLLHGSANPIGGQNVIMKLRWGSFSNDLIMKRAPQGIKFALGENVKRKRSYGRYPETRMGVEQVIRDAFNAASDYKRKWNTYRRDVKLQRSIVPPRKDLELEALVEIMEGDRLLHAHSYRQDEILMLTRIAEDFGFTISTFQHVLEGYKVAERLAEHGAGASTFSDWWAYKYEVVDAIPHNGTLMANAGVSVSFNSDSDELARRMNLEAAKAVKYGGMSEEDALKLVTINPAQQLKIDKYVGSLEIGKDADFAIWSGHPLSTYSICEETWLDGKQYFSTPQDKYFRQRDNKLRNDLIQKILSSDDKGGQPMKPQGMRGIRFHHCDATEAYFFGGEH